jgi:two-component system heavy metal sensor histidine kinase CusS
VIQGLRFRMMALFCAVVSILLAASYLAFYGLLRREVDSQLDRQLFETARPVVADLVTDPTEQDVNQLDLPGAYFELLDASGRVLQSSKNLRGQTLDLGALQPDPDKPLFGTARSPQHSRLRAALVPFQRQGQLLALAVAMPDQQAHEVLENFRHIALWFFPLSLLVTAAVSAWYVGRSLEPVTELTCRAARTTARLAEPGSSGLWDPLEVRHAHDELRRLAQTFNQLFARLEVVLRQLRQFVTDAAHELRTPLSVLEGETELLLAQPRTPEEYQRALRVMEDEVKKLIRIVEGLFTLSMADAGQLRLNAEPLYLNEVLEEACALVSSRARAKDIAIDRQLGQDIPYVGDEAFLRQLFLIFLDNAIKYSPSRSRVSVRLDCSAGCARIRFEDQGVGIPPEHLPRIFERFYRAAPSGSGEADGGGLGLAIAQAIVTAMRGSIRCESAPGRGSTFTVTLPLEPGPLPVLPARSEACV